MAALPDLNMITDGDRMRRKISERVLEYFRKWSVLMFYCSTVRLRERERDN